MPKYFTHAEVHGLHSKLVSMLDLARDVAGVPIIITSGFRTPDQNKKAGGVKDSAHEQGLAVDIRAPNDEYGKRIAFALGAVGFKRVGFYSKHLHADIDSTKHQTIWNGGESK